MKLYRIYTENKNIVGIKDILNDTILSYTLFYGVGCWNRVEETSLVIEIVAGKEQSIEWLENIALRIKELNNQQAVLLTVQEIESKLV